MRQSSYDFMMLYAVKVLISSHTCREIAFNFKKINKSEAKMLEDIEQCLGGISGK
ncbi:MAG TPA: hypothetical protein PK622_00925 [Saprospiraceae bacterium]|jgi:hypothetical protein|nr:hypothetical protein [Saprospiraceae bacterium]